MSNDLSHKLLKIRQNLSLSQEELAEKLGVSFATVNRVGKWSLFSKKNYNRDHSSAL